MEYTQEELEKIVTDCGCQFLGIKEHFPEDGPLLYFNTPSGSTKTVKLRGKSLDEIKKNIEGKTVFSALLKEAQAHACVACKNFLIDATGGHCLKELEAKEKYGDLLFAEWLENYLKDNECGFFEPGGGRKMQFNLGASMEKKSWLKTSKTFGDMRDNNTLFDEHCMGDPKGQEEIPQDQLKMGVEVEKEHAPTLNKIKASIENGEITMSPEEIYASIAQDHLREFGDYYTRLSKMEAEAKQEKK